MLKNLRYTVSKLLRELSMDSNFDQEPDELDLIISHLILVTRNHVSIRAGAPQVSWRLTRLQSSRFQEVLKKEFQVLVCSLECGHPFKSKLSSFQTFLLALFV